MLSIFSLLFLLFCSIITFYDGYYCFVNFLNNLPSFKIIYAKSTGMYYIDNLNSYGQILNDTNEHKGIVFMEFNETNLNDNVCKLTINNTSIDYLTHKFIKNNTYYIFYSNNDNDCFEINYLNIIIKSFGILNLFIGFILIVIYFEKTFVKINNYYKFLFIKKNIKLD
jgi:hypothetical protein